VRLKRNGGKSGGSKMAGDQTIHTAAKSKQHDVVGDEKGKKEYHNIQT
jgi:hypothetical protein